MFKLVALVLAAAASVIAAPSCNAEGAGGSVYFTDTVHANFGPIAVTPGQTLTATLVNVKTCQPFAGFSSAKLGTFTGTVLDNDFTYDQSFEDSVNSTTTTGNKLTTYAGVPNGSKDLSFSASVIFTPGGLSNWQLVTQNLGVIFTAA